MTAPHLFSALRAILQRHAGTLAVSDDTPTRYFLAGGSHLKDKTPMPIAWVRVRLLPGSLP